MVPRLSHCDGRIHRLRPSTGRGRTEPEPESLTTDFEFSRYNPEDTAFGNSATQGFFFTFFTPIVGSVSTFQEGIEP